jgi:hypothetical protein
MSEDRALHNDHCEHLRSYMKGKSEIVRVMLRYKYEHGGLTT